MLGPPAIVAAWAISLCAWPAADRLGDHTDVLDAGLAQLVYHGGEAAEGDALIAADENGLRGCRARALVDQIANLVDVHRLVAQVDALRAVNGHDQAVVGNLFHRLRFGQIDFDPGLQDGR